MPTSPTAGAGLGLHLEQVTLRPPSGPRQRAAHQRSVRSKLSLFMRSRWFDPLDGMKMASLMYDAVTTGDTASAVSFCFRRDMGLTFVTVTDFHGCQLNMQFTTRRSFTAGTPSCAISYRRRDSESPYRF